MSGILICINEPANAGYAIEPLEIAFYTTARRLFGVDSRIYLSYHDFSNGYPRWYKGDNKNLITLKYKSMSAMEFNDLSIYIANNDIEYVLAFDLPVGAEVCRHFRKGGVKFIFSYWGAPMSSINYGVKILLKRLQVKLTTHKPDHFIFESEGMQRTATNGRGINIKNTSVVRLGIDADKYISVNKSDYAHKLFNIPIRRKIIFYSGHMEKRKGVDVLIKAASLLVNSLERDDLHFLICGDRPGEKESFTPIFEGTDASRYITFGGYRNDIPELMSSCYAAVIASTGWDSFPRSSLEMAAAGLPLIVSDIPGLNETIDPETTGLLFTPADYQDLASKIEYIADDPEVRSLYSTNSTQRIRDQFTLEIQQKNLLNVIKCHICVT